MLPPLTVGVLRGVVKGMRCSAGGLDGWRVAEWKALPARWWDALAQLYSAVETHGVWPEAVLDGVVSMIPKADGDATPLGQRPLTVLSVFYRVWAAARLGHLLPWVKGWLPDCVFSQGVTVVPPSMRGMLRPLRSKRLWSRGGICLWRSRISSRPLTPSSVAS